MLFISASLEANSLNNEPCSIVFVAKTDSPVENSFAFRFKLAIGLDDDGTPNVLSWRKQVEETAMIRLM